MVQELHVAYWTATSPWIRAAHCRSHDIVLLCAELVGVWMVQPGLEAFECMTCFTAVCDKCSFIRPVTERRTWSHLLQRVCEAHFQVVLSRLLCVACAHRHAWLMINGRIWFLHNSTRTCVRSATLCGISPFYVIFVRQLWRRFFKWKYFYFCFHISYVGFQTQNKLLACLRQFCLFKVSDYFSSLLLCWVL